MPVKTLQRTHRLGLEVTEGIIWQGWQPGGEYTKNIILKNVDVKSKRLKYRIPATQFFTTKYPQPIILSSGTSLNLPVTFRPLEKEKYEDQIIFETKDGNFSVPIKAALPDADILLPETVDFELCAVGDQRQQSLEVINISDLEISFNISCEVPFNVRPNQGHLLPHSKSTLTVDFKPKGAFVYSFDAICAFGAENEDIHTKKIVFQGTGKYAYIGVKYGQQIGHDIALNFKDVPLSNTSEKTVEVINYTPVSTPFQVIQPSFDSSVDKAYKCSQYHGIVPGNGKINIKISYTPSVSDIQQADSFEILALGSSHGAMINCTGHGTGPKVSLEVSSINFGLVNKAGIATRSFQLINESPSDAFFQLQLDDEFSVFKCETKCGKLSGCSSKTFILTFAPEQPINYYRRITWLIYNQGPLYLDLFGTCHSDQVSPGVLQRKHIESYRTHKARGLTRVPPEDLRNWLQEGRLEVGNDGCLNITDVLLDEELQQFKVDDDDPMDEYFNDEAVGELITSPPHVSVDVKYIEFGRCSHGKVYHKTVNVTNHTHGTICCIWNSGKKGSPFSIHPAEVEIESLQNASFSVRFKPDVSGQFFLAELEGYAFYKSVKDHHHNQDVTLCPPWCLTTNASGHTFIPKSETFLPHYQMESNIVFAPVTSLQPSYKTFLLVNNGSDPIDFAFDEDESRTFTCKPSKGLFYDKYQIVVFRYLPDDFGACSKKLRCTLNASEKYSKPINLVGSAEILNLQIQAQEAVYFQPTYVGTSTNLKVLIKNPCRIPLRFEWRIPAADKDVLSVQPVSGIISSNETQTHNWSFKPKSESKYLFKVKLSADSIEQSSNNHRRHLPMLRLIGEGQKGSLLCQPGKLDFGDVIVGNTLKKSMHLLNENDCGLHFQLKIEEEIEGVFEKNGNLDNGKTVLQLSDYKGFIPARSRKAIQVKMHPQHRYKCVSKISYHLVSSQENAADPDKSADLGQCICVATVNGVFPTLAINDVRGMGCAERNSRRLLWDLFSIDRFNSCLDSDPSSEELIYKVPTRHSTRRRMPVHTRAVVDFNFNSAPHLSEPCHVLINLQNTGSAPAEWTFLFPTDLQLDMEFWAQTGELDDDELHEMFVLDHSLFSIQPKRGNLDPGGSQVISLSYSHSAIGMHKLPVLFKVSKGREILLNFIGSTISLEDKHLHFSTAKHLFDTIPIGRSMPPIQFFPLRNGGAQPVQFQLDISPLDEIQEKNCGWRIFDCLNPSGTIPPGETELVSWVFSPLEAKTYMVDIMIYTVGGESTFITFTGIGYDPAVMGPTVAFADMTDDSLPKKQLISVPEQLVYLSEERLTFDNIPVMSAVNRIIFLKNTSTQFAASFRWLLDSFPQSEVLSIEPQQGYINPSEYVICKVKFFSEGPPAIYDLDCLCEIANETLMARYNKEILQWHRKEDEKKVHFTITESDLKKSRPGSGSTKLKSIGATSKYVNRSDSDLQKYDALPPIGIAPNDTSPNGKPAPSEPPEPPEPPRGFIVHLSVSARTHSVEEFCSTFIDAANQFLIKGKPLKLSNDATDVEVQKRFCSKEEHDTITGTIPLIIMDLLQSKDFQDAIKTIQEEPIPYFGMLRSEGSHDLQGSIDEKGLNKEIIQSETRDDVSPTDEDATEAVIHESRDDKDEIEPDKDEVATDAPLDDSKVATEDIADEGSGQNLKNADEQEPSDVKSSVAENVALLEKQRMKSSDEFSKLLEEIFENTICNIMSEASKREVNLTARPRLVALPPSAKGNRMNHHPR